MAVLAKYNPNDPNDPNNFLYRTGQGIRNIGNYVNTTTQGVGGIQPVGIYDPNSVTVNAQGQQGAAAGNALATAADMTTLPMRGAAYGINSLYRGMTGSAPAGGFNATPISNWAATPSVGGIQQPVESSSQPGFLSTVGQALKQTVMNPLALSPAAAPAAVTSGPRNDTLAPTGVLSPAPQPTYSVTDRGPEGQGAGTGTIKDMATGKTYSDFAPVAQGVGSAFQQNYDYLAKPQVPVVQGMRPQVQSASPAAPQMIAPIEQAATYAPNRSDNSMGGMFVQGLRMKQDRAYAGMNDAVTKNAIAQQAQGITAQGQAIMAANDVEKNRLTESGQMLTAASEAEKNKAVGIRNSSQAMLEGVQAEGLRSEIQRKQTVDALINERSKTTDTAEQARLDQEIHLRQGREAAKPEGVHWATEQNSNLSSSTVGMVRDPTSPTGFTKIVPQQPMQDQFIAAASAVKPDKLAAFQKKYEGQQMTAAHLAELKALAKGK